MTFSCLNFGLESRMISKMNIVAFSVKISCMLMIEPNLFWHFENFQNQNKKKSRITSEYTQVNLSFWQTIATNASWICSWWKNVNIPLEWSQIIVKTFSKPFGKWWQNSLGIQAPLPGFFSRDLFKPSNQSHKENLRIRSKVNKWKEKKMCYFVGCWFQIVRQNICWT